MSSNAIRADALAGKLKRTEIQHRESSIPGRELVQVLTEIPAGVESGWHMHPGEEVGYILAGTVEMRIDGKSTLTLHEGDGFLMTPNTPHNALDLGPETGMMLRPTSCSPVSRSQRSPEPRRLTTRSRPVHGLVESVSVGTPRPVEVNGHSVLTAIWKHSVPGRVPLRGVNLRGDDQADRTVHGGSDKAVYAYARVDIEWWEAELARPLGHAPFGENLTVRGLPVSQAVIGEQWAIGSALLQVAQPRLPCFKLGLRMGDPRFVKHFATAGRPGAYLRVLREGDIAAGDQIEVTSRPDHGVTSALVSRALLGERRLLAAALAAPELPTELRSWMQERAA